MSEFSPLAERDWPSPIKLERVLSELQIEYLAVNDQRLYVTFTETVLEVCVRFGTFSTAETLSVAVVEEPARPNADSESIVADFLNLLEDTAASDRRQ